MSAYMVDDTTINKVVNYLYTKQLGDKHYYPARILRDAGYDLQKKEDRERLAHAMFKLNIMAVDCRYGEGEAKEFRPLDFEYQSMTPSNAITTLKALHCWQYQCSEGFVPQLDLFKLMGKVADAITHKIVSDMPAYQQAKWG